MKSGTKYKLQVDVVRWNDILTKLIGHLMTVLFVKPIFYANLSSKFVFFLIKCQRLCTPERISTKTNLAQKNILVGWIETIEHSISQMIIILNSSSICRWKCVFHTKRMSNSYVWNRKIRTNSTIGTFDISKQQSKIQISRWIYSKLLLQTLCTRAIYRSDIGNTTKTQTFIVDSQRHHTTTTRIINIDDTRHFSFVLFTSKPKLICKSLL